MNLTNLHSLKFNQTLILHVSECDNYTPKELRKGITGEWSYVTLDESSIAQTVFLKAGECLQ